MVPTDLGLAPFQVGPASSGHQAGQRGLQSPWKVTWAAQSEELLRISGIAFLTGNPGWLPAGVPCAFRAEGRACRGRTPGCPWAYVIWCPVLCSPRVVAVRWDWQSVALCAAVHPFVPPLRKGGKGAISGLSPLPPLSPSQTSWALGSSQAPWSPWRILGLGSCRRGGPVSPRYPCSLGSCQCEKSSNG